MKENARELLIDIKDLSTGFRIDGKYYNAIDGVSLHINSNEILAIVGESGCGKSTLATSIMGLHDPNYTKSQGEIMFNGVNLLALDEPELNKIRGKEIGMIFQDPLSALNPLMRIESQIMESLTYHTDYTTEEKRKISHELLDQVGIPNVERVARMYPHQLSGGMRQRVIIAIALACKPKVLIADEPTTALDVTIQAQILDLLMDLQDEVQAAIVLITHDLGVVAQTADRVAVMYAGEVVELATAKELFSNPLHPYTRSLMNAIPSDDNNEDDLYVIEGVVPSLKNLPRDGCRFAGRVSSLSPSDHETNTQLREVSPGHFVRCTCWEVFEIEKSKGGNKQ